MANLRALVERHYHNMSSGNIDAESDIFSPNVETLDPSAGTLHGLEAFQGYERGFQRAFPDGRLELRTAVEGDNLIAAEGTFSGTNSGPLTGPAGEMPPTNRRLELHFAELFEVDGGRIVKHRIYYDQVDFMVQLGLMPQG